MVAVLGETTAGYHLPRMRDAILLDPENTEGKSLLKDRPRLNTETIDVEKLKVLNDGSFGRAYVEWLEKCGVSPDTREPVSSCACVDF